MRQTATLTETIWTVPNVLGLVLGLVFLSLVVGDARFQVQTDGSDLVRLRAWDNVWNEIVQCLIMLLFSIAGVVQMFSYPSVPVPPGTPLSIGSLVTVVSLTLTPFILDANSIRKFVARRALYAADARQHSGLVLPASLHPERRKREESMPAKPWYTSKTIWAQVIGAAISILILVAASPAVEKYAIYVSLVVNALTVVLRTITTQPISGGS